MTEFHGAKLILTVSGRLVVLERDYVPGIAWPGYLDLPGGGRDPGEAPEETVLRELFEETTLVLGRGQLHTRTKRRKRKGVAYTFSARIRPGEVSKLKLGNEGQRILLMHPARFVAHPRAIPALRRVVAQHFRRQRP